ncbi:ephrin-A3 [Osmerus eperlanus]|uniref:ephrin-A3 n=1 Tax=Osmerus eperlanus TaxID=29151 RepID=UPI002E138E28
MALATFSFSLLTLALTNLHLARANNRHAVYWNSSNLHLRKEGYTVQVSVNDYLDIYCPHYNASQRGALERSTAEQYVLYMVSYRGYRTCDPQMGFKRWECNRPHAPHAPIKFSEKFQRYSAFSLGYEFNVGHEYYYISTPTHHHGHSCLRLRVYVCCSTVSQADDDDDDDSQTPPDYTVRPNIKINDIDEFNPEVPKLEKSVSGSSPSRDRLLLTVATLLISAYLVS